MESGASLKTAFVPEEILKKEREAFFEELNKELAKTGQPNDAIYLLCELFPVFERYQSSRKARIFSGKDGTSETAEKEKRISHIDYFPIYFRYQVPETAFSQTELETFISALNLQVSADRCIALFSEFWNTLPKQSPKRYDFLHKIRLSVGAFKDTQAEALAEALAISASDYIYDTMLFSAAEAGRALLTIFEIAQRFAKSPKAQHILETAIAKSTDDTFAFRLLSLSIDPSRNQILTDFSNVRTDALKTTFAERMEKRYGPETAISEIKLAYGDRRAFVIWAQTSPSSRDFEVQFWRRFIGHDLNRLAEAARFIFPNNVLWSTDPTPHIDQLFPVAEFEALLNICVPSKPLTEDESKTLDFLRRLIKGEFKNGVEPSDL